MDDKIYYVYMLTNDSRSTIYTGVTNHLRRRVLEHKNGMISGFTRKYKVYKLVYAEAFPYVINAIEREKKIKKGSRAKKIALIEKMNPTWDDLTGRF